MTAKQGALLVTKEERTVTQVQGALGSSTRIELAGVCRDLGDLRSQLTRTPASAVVVDMDSYPASVLSSLAGVVATSGSGVPVVVVAEEFDESSVLTAMRVGARHFLRKNAVASDLDAILESLLFGTRSEEAGLGQVISVFSASGGCGATTVAANLANELRLLCSGHVLAVDLDDRYGALGAYLGLRGRYGIADVLNYESPIDRDLIQSIALNYKTDYHVLLSPVGTHEDPEALRSLDRVGEAMEACRRVYAYTVVDAPRLLRRAILNLASVSRFSVVVFQLTVKDVNFTRSLVEHMQAHGVPPETILPVANRVRNRGPLVRLEDSRQAIGMPHCERIRSDWRTAMKAMNRGACLADIAKMSGLRRDMRGVARHLYKNIKAPVNSMTG